jgi:hypothetical protein
VRRGILVLIAFALAGCGGSTSTVKSIAAPTTTTTNAQPAANGDASAKALVRSAQVAAETLATDQGGSYSGMSPAKLQQYVPALGSTAGAKLTSAAADASGQGYSLTGRADATGDTFTLTRSADGTIARTCHGTGCVGGSW